MRDANLMYLSLTVMRDANLMYLSLAVMHDANLMYLGLTAMRDANLMYLSFTVMHGALWLLKFVGCKFIFDLGLLGRGLILSTTLSIIMAELSNRRCRRSILNLSEKKEEK